MLCVVSSPLPAELCLYYGSFTYTDMDLLVHTKKPTLWNTICIHWLYVIRCTFKQFKVSNDNILQIYRRSYGCLIIVTQENICAPGNLTIVGVLN